MEEKQKTVSKSLKLLYFQIVDLWKRLCEEHSVLYDHSSDEYLALLESDMDKIETIVQEKTTVVKKIEMLEKHRQQLIERLNEYFAETGATKKVSSASELIDAMEDIEDERNQKHLFRFNKVLINIIEKIQEQNKKNQLFINKAIHSLKEVEQVASGNQPFTLYNAQGTTKQASDRI